MGEYMNHNSLCEKIAIAAIILMFAAPVGIAQPPDHKVVICHYPPGNPDNPRTIEIDESALPAHIGPLGHGPGLDYLGPCKGNNQIPEFGSIALPAAGALGMMFLFMRNRKKT